MNTDSQIDLHQLRHQLSGVVGGLLTARDIYATHSEKNEAMTGILDLCHTRLMDVLSGVETSIKATDKKNIGEI